MAAHIERPAAVRAGSDPLLAGQSHLPQIGWTPPPQTGPRPLVAVLDTGVDATAPDLAGVVLTGAGRSFVPESPDPGADPSGHGTHVAGIIGAVTGNGVGGAGVASARILPVTVADAQGDTTASALVRGLAYASSRGARVINISFGGRGFSKAEQDAIDAATRRGALVVAAAGNTGGSAAPDYPGAYRQVLDVGALSAAGRPLNVSARGPQIALAAPGEAVLSTAPGASPALVPRTGTSMAAAVVSGAAARVIAARPKLTPAQVRQVLEESARDVPPTGPDTGTGAGALDLAAALAEPAPPRGDPEPNDDPVLALGTPPLLAAERPGPAHGARPHRVVERPARRLQRPPDGRPAPDRAPARARGQRPRPRALAPRRPRRPPRRGLRAHLARGRLARPDVGGGHRLPGPLDRRSTRSRCRACGRRRGTP